MTTARFLSGSTMGHVARMTLTGAMGITFVFLLDAANLFWIAQLGDPKQLAATGFAFAIQFFSVSVGIGLMIASTALVSRAIGAGDRARARRTVTAAAITAGSFQLVNAGVILWFLDPILALSGAEGETAEYAARYLRISLPSISIMAVGMVANGALRAEGDGKRSMYVTLTSGAVAMIIDPFLIYGLGWGLDGAAVGLILFRVVMISMAFYYAIGLYDLIAKPDWSDFKANLRPYLAIAIPAMLTQLATPVGNYLLTLSVAPFGDEAVAGWSVVGRLAVVAFGGIFSLSGAIGGIFGQNFGAGAFDRLRSTYRNALLFGLIYTLITWALLALATPLVIAGFGLSGQAIEVVRAFSYLGAGAYVFSSALFVSNAAFNALGKPIRSTILNWTRDGILILPLALWLTGIFGAPGAVYAQTLAAAVVGGLAVVWGWRFVLGLSQTEQRQFEPEATRPYPSADRFRRR